MNGQTAEIFAAQLERVWASLWTSGRELSCCWGQDKPPRFRWSCTDGQGMEVQVLASSHSIARVILRQGNLELLWNGKAIESISRYSPQHQAVQAFVAEWAPIFRRNCWLSGCKISANITEQAEWIQSFTAEEIALWDLDREIKVQRALDEKIDSQIPRVAAAFRVETLDEIERNPEFTVFRSNQGAGCFVCVFDNSGELDYLSLSPRETEQSNSECFITRFDDEWEVEGTRGEYAEYMVQGLYCLDFEDEEVFAKLPSLSAHERLELRRSLPREFWPQKWLDEDTNR